MKTPACLIDSMKNFRSTMTSLCVAVLMLVAGSEVFAQPVLQTPIEGQYLRDYFIVNYVDQDTAVGASHDPFCGSKTYDGNYGTDFVLRDYRQLDSGVNILAAAAGTVIKVVDTLFDRQTNGASSLGFGNYIAIWHRVNGVNYYSYYAHLRKGSAKVDSGSVVSSGQVIAQAACSGYCLAPNLHFELWNDVSVLDPFSGPCSFEKTHASYWATQLPYDTSFALVQQGLIDTIPSYALVRERPPQHSSFSYPAPDSVIGYWLEARGIRKNDSLIAEWRRPDGSLWYHFGTQSDADYWLGWWWTSILHPAAFKGVDGDWQVNFILNNTQISSQHFICTSTQSEVVDDASPGLIISQLGHVVVLQASPGATIGDIHLYDVLGRPVTFHLREEAPGRSLIQFTDDSPATLALQCRVGGVVFSRLVRR